MMESTHVVYGTGSAIVRDPDGTERQATPEELEKILKRYEPALEKSFALTEERTARETAHKFLMEHSTIFRVLEPGWHWLWSTLDGRDLRDLGDWPMSRLVQIRHAEALDFNIPEAAIRGYEIHADAFFVDKRRLRRHIRRARRAPCANPLREWWHRKLNAMERRL